MFYAGANVKRADVDCGYGRRRKLDGKLTQVLIKPDCCDRLPEIEVANVGREKLEIYLVSRTDPNVDSVRALFESSHFDDIVIYLIVLEGPHDFINHVCEVCKDSHEETKNLHDDILRGEGILRSLSVSIKKK